MVGVTSRNLQTQRPEPLTREEEYDLILRAKAGEERAMTRLIHKNKGLIKKAINRYDSQVDWRVLTTAGEMAVIKSVHKFDLSTGNKFSTYLVHTIRSEVRECFCDETGISRDTLNNLSKISKASAALSQELDRDPTLEEIADRSELSQRQILNAWGNKAFAQPLSFNQRFDEDCPEWLDSQVDETVDLWRASEDAEILELLDQLERDGYLEDRQVTMLIAKHQGFNNKEVGAQLGISGERVRQLLKKAEATLADFKAGTLKPKPIETTIPVSAQHNIEPIVEDDQPPVNLPVPEEIRVTALKRVDAFRLGGRIGRAIKQIFNQTKECFNDQLKGLTHAQKHILVFRRCSSHRTADRSGHQPTSADQRCCGLEQVRNPWRGYLEVSQGIQQQLASAYQRIRGFGIKLNQWRNNGRFSLTNVFENLGIVHGNSPPRPPTDHKDKFSMETNSFPFGGPNMDVVSQETKEKIAVCFGIVACLATIYWGLDWNHWSQIPEEIRLLSGFDWAECLDWSSLYKVMPENRLESLISVPVIGLRIIEVIFFAGFSTLLSTLVSLWGLNLILPSRGKEYSFNPSQDKNHRDLP